MSAHANSVKEWKERAKAAEQAAVQARNTIRLLQTLLNEKEETITDLRMQIMAASGQVPMEDLPDDYDDENDDEVDAGPSNVVAIDANKALTNMFGDIEVEIEAEGFKTEGVDSEGNVLEPAE